MRIVQLGEGRPEVAVVGAVHGDEPCGPRAIERLVDDDPAVERPVKLVVANEAALDAGVRYVDWDLNRAFGDGVSEAAHEYDLAPRLAAALEGCVALSIHSTRSTDEPFALVKAGHDRAKSICPFLSVAALVEVDAEEGRLFATDAELIELEAGLQGTEAAAENAYRIAREFLTAVGVLPGETLARELPRFALGDPIPKPPGERYRVLGENFQRVAAGEPYAEVDGEPLVAETAFYPVLLSADGYDDIFGYRGQPLDPLAAPDIETPR
ncbi:MAG: succinylglutamate desuccinylase/aspartoacylase family protein [Halobacteriales archaeon]